MRIFSIFFSLCLISLFSCANMPNKFTTENVMKVKQGMSSNEIIELFGEPQSVGASVCGMQPDQWTCTTWKYEEFPNTRGRFVFAGEADSLVLNNFSINKY